jgi:hypothetical protein
MGFNFPLSPAIGTLHPATAIAGAPQYVWDGQVWKVTTNFASPQYVLKAGDTMSGDLEISKATPGIVLRKSAAAQFAAITSTNGANSRWAVAFADSTAESGSNAGSNFSISRYNDAGSPIDTPLTINRASGRALLAVSGAAVPVNPAGLQIAFNGNAAIETRPAADNTYPAIFENAAGTVVGYIQTTPTATAFSTTSDERLKEDLQEFKAADAASIIDNTNVYDFKWRSGERAYGIIAQQAVTVYPAAVSHMTEPDVWGVDYSKYVPVILQELKALRARVAELEAAIMNKPI